MRFFAIATSLVLAGVVAATPAALTAAPAAVTHTKIGPDSSTTIIIHNDEAGKANSPDSSTTIIIHNDDVYVCSVH
jgi:alpha-D-ribose 1-methylphosphonate 5-triphosphate synthase subunit PhnH